MKKMLSIIIILLLVCCFPISVFAHQGRTDENGGHYVRDTGEYHYHHGFPEHQHENGICPYEYDVFVDDDDNYDYDSHQTYHSGYKEYTYEEYLAKVRNQKEKETPKEQEAPKEESHNHTGWLIFLYILLGIFIFISLLGIMFDPVFYHAKLISRIFLFLQVIPIFCIVFLGSQIHILWLILFCLACYVFSLLSSRAILKFVLKKYFHHKD